MMISYENNAFFWQKIDTLVFSSKFVLKQEIGSQHPAYKNLIYPVKYGNLVDLAEDAEEGISVFRGSEKASTVNALIIAADILKKDLECKLLIGCTEDELTTILRFLNQTDFQKTILVRRGNEIPSWSITD